MFFSECDVLPSPQSSSPRAAEFLLGGPPGATFSQLCVFLREKIDAEIDAPKIGKSRPKAPPGLRNVAKIDPKMVPGTTFFAA